MSAMSDLGYSESVRTLRPQSGVFVIAEAGKNFIQTKEEKSTEEYLENAKELARLAKEAGADAVKFQTHSVEDEQLDVSVTAPHFSGSDRFSWVTRNTLATPLESFWNPLKQYCDDIGIAFFTTPMSRGAAIRISSLGVPFWKVGSGDILDFVLLDYLAGTQKPIILSTGMSTVDELDVAIRFLRERNASPHLMHCVSRYPCPPEELRLGTIRFLQERYSLPVGFSDHSIGWDGALVAVSLGASIIEKHFSLSRDLWGSDHKVSMTPDEFKGMASGIRNLESDESARAQMLTSKDAQKMLSSETKELQEDEAVFRPYFRKSLVVGTDLPAGSVLKEEYVYAMRPQKFIPGLPSERYDDVVGKRLKRSLKRFDPITEDAVS